jgi:phage-related protein
MVKQGQAILGNIIKGISDSLPSLIEMLDTLFEVIHDTMATNGPQIAELVTNGAMKILQSVYKSEPGFVNAVMKILEGMMKALRDNLPQTLVLARQTTNQMIQVLVDNLPEFIALGSEVIMALIQGLVDSIPQMIDQIPVMVNLFVNTMLGLLYLYVQVGYKIVLSIIQGIQSYAQNIPNVGNQIMNNLKDTLLNWLWQFSQIGVRLLQSMGQGIRNQVGALLQQGRNVISQVVSSFSNGSLWNTGYNLIVGLWNGMSYMKNWIVSKAQNLAYSVMNAVRNAFRIGSPSKVFAYYGEMNMEGLSIGMASQEKEIQSQIDGMFNLQPSVSPMMTITRENTDLVSAFSDLINEMNDRPIALDIRADEGIIVKKATEGFREFQRANGRLPF